MVEFLRDTHKNFGWILVPQKIYRICKLIVTYCKFSGRMETDNECKVSFVTDENILKWLHMPRGERSEGSD